MPTPRKSGATAPRVKPGNIVTAPTGGGGATTVGPGGIAGPLTGTVGAPMGTLATSDSSGFGVLGWFTVDAEGCTVQFGIDQQRYALDASAANYDALFSMLLACWLEGRKVSLTYSTAPVVVVLDPDAPRRILSLVTI